MSLQWTGAREQRTALLQLNCYARNTSVRLMPLQTLLISNGGYRPRRVQKLSMDSRLRPLVSGSQCQTKNAASRLKKA
jgi:hypothetical protein